MTRFESYLYNKRNCIGSIFDDSDLTSQFIPYFNSQARIEVKSPNGYTRRGRVAATTGWKPCFILIHRISDHGSSDVLTSEDTVTRIIAD